MKLRLDFLHPYWTGVTNKISPRDTPLMVELGRWAWWYCDSGHCKILANKQPSCPICNISMTLKVDASPQPESSN